MSDSTELLSIITVSFRDLDRLKRTVDSLIGIDPRVEHIIVLPDSDYESVEFLDCFLVEHPDAALSYVHDKGQGIYQAMNLGVSYATCKYFTFWNAGDELNSSLEMSSLLNELILCESNWVLTNGYFSWIDYPHPSLENLLSFIRQESAGYVSHQCVLFKRLFFIEGAVFDFRYKVASDTDQIFRCYRNSTPKILDYSVVAVEIGQYSAVNHRRARLEVLLIIIRRLNSLDLLLALYNYSRNNLSYLLMKSRKLRF